MGYTSKRARRLPSKYGKRAYMKRAPTLTNIVESVVRKTSELKYLITSGTDAFVIPGSYNGHRLSNPAQGSTDSERTGDRLTLRSIVLNLTVYDNTITTTAFQQNEIRVMLVQWLPLQLSVSPSPTDVLQTANVNSAYKHDNRQMYRVLMDKQVVVIGNPSSPYARQQLTYTHVFKKHQNVQFQSGGLDHTNGLYLISFAAGMGVSYTCQMDFNAKVNYYDS